jgi:hypothetical protein
MGEVGDETQKPSALVVGSMVEERPRWFVIKKAR